MAQALGGNSVRLNNGQTVQAQNLGWYDGQQFVNGSLSNPGQIHPDSGQQGAGQQVSKEVVAQTNPNNVAYIQQQQQQAGIPAAVPAGGGFAATGDGSGGAGAGTGAGFSSPDVLNLPNLYTNLYQKAGISDLEAQIANEEKGFNDAQSKINDNPFLSESSRVGRVQKLQTDYNNNTATLRDQIATKKADVETQLNLATKQFDINSQSAQQALERFNSLLSSGALENASGEDIANITRATGLSSNAIYSAVNAQKKKNQQTSVIQYDDGTNQGFAVVDTQTGQILNKQVVAASKPKSGGSGAYTVSQGLQTVTPQIVSRLNSYGNIGPSDWNTALAAWIGAGLNKNDFISNYGQYADTNRGDFLAAYGFQNPKTETTIKQNQANKNN